MSNKKNDKVKQIKEPKKVVSPVELFFKLGDKVTGGDPIRKASFDYYLMIIIFLAFLFIFAGNMINFLKSYQIQYLGWAGFAIAISWFQYFNLQAMYRMRKYQRELPKKQEEAKEQIETVNEMLDEFSDNKGG